MIEREESIVMLLREEKFCYEAANGRKVRLLPPDAPVPEIANAPNETWDVWEFNFEDEVLKAGPPISPLSRRRQRGSV